jgi:acetyl-CoA carboxylase carboxyltransferase component
MSMKDKVAELHRRREAASAGRWRRQAGQAAPEQGKLTARERIERHGRRQL